MLWLRIKANKIQKNLQTVPMRRRQNQAQVRSSRCQECELKNQIPVDRLYLVQDMSVSTGGIREYLSRSTL